MRIPPKLHPEIMARHAAGQSDQAIADWLAHLDPPVTVSRVAILQTRQRLGGVKPRSAAPPTSTPSSGKLSGGKLSGAQGAKVRAIRTTQEAKDHKKRGAVIISVPAERNTERAHSHALAVQLELQGIVNADTVMTLPDKLRASSIIAQAIAKLSVQAELERKIEELEHERAVEVEDLKAELRRVEIDQRRNEAERAQLDEEWKKLREEQARLAALGGSITHPQDPAS